VVNERIGNNRKLPDYFGVSVEIAGRNLIAVTNLDREVEGPLDKNVGPARAQSNARRFPSQVLAVDRANSALSDQLKVHVQLTRPTALYARQRTRTLWFGLLISASTCAALAGLATAWAAFRRQLRLAEMKTNFVSSVSHELRAPIASVRLMAESLDRGTVSDAHKQTEYFRLIVQECRRLTSLIENVLDFSRIDQGRRQYEFEPTDLGALVRQTIQLMEPNAAERQITLSGTVPPEPITADLDGKAIQQALINLLDNAIKHSPPETGVTVGLEMSLNSQPSTVNLFVEDHGGGIPPEEHGKIFEPFYRRGTELRRETQGIGIGLTIVKHIVEAHGGKATVRSAVGQGSRFTIELPVKNGETPFRE
jgi:signal transduction histidine kinase